MPKTVSKRALEGQRWRIQAREKRRLNTIIAKYVEEKDMVLYARCVNYYDTVVTKYPQVQNLTKIAEFQNLLATEETQTGEQQDQPQPEITVSEQQDQPQPEITVSEQQDQPQPEITASEQQDQPQAEITVSEQQDQPQAEITVSEQQDQLQAEITVSEQQDQSQAEISVSESRNETVTPGYTYVEPGLIINEYIINNDNEDILSQAVNATITEFDEGIDRLADMETIVNNIIHDLEAVEPSVFDGINDEGIGLSTEEEFGNILNEYNIDNLW